MNFPPKTLVVGAKGFLGNAFFQYYRSFYPDLIATHRVADSLFQKLDLSDPHWSFESFDLNGYSYALIAAAIPNTLFCENEPKKSRQVNVEGTLRLVKALVERKIVPIVFSSDYVFDGKSGSYQETSSLNPLNQYGMQKFELEQRIARDFEKETLVVRLSKVYGTRKGDRTLIDEMISSMVSGKPVRAAVDLTFCPIEIGDAVRAVAELQRCNARGLYQVCGDDALTRFELANRVQKSLGVDKGLLIRISLDELNETFLRPKRTDMSNARLCTMTGMKMTGIDWSLESLVRQYRGN